MSVIKRKSNIALITVTIIILLLIPIWYMMLIPSIIASEIEKIDATTTYEGTFTGQACQDYYGVWELPIRVEAYLHTIEVKGDNVILRLDVTMTRNDTGETLPELSSNSTFVINKFTRENVLGAPEASNPNRTGYYDPLYPSHLKAGENITNVWLDMLNTTGILEFKESKVEKGITLYKYFVNKTITQWMTIPPLLPGNFTLIYTKTILIEPLSGLLAYTENETFYLYIPRPGTTIPQPIPVAKLVYPLTYKNTPEAKDEGIELAKTSHDGIQLLELYLPTILGVVAIILVVGLAFNIRRLQRKMAPQAKTRSSASRKH